VIGNLADMTDIHPATVENPLEFLFEDPGISVDARVNAITFDKGAGVDSYRLAIASPPAHAADVLPAHLLRGIFRGLNQAERSARAARFKAILQRLASATAVFYLVLDGQSLRVSACPILEPGKSPH
jgi:hypothetical protein